MPERSWQEGLRRGLAALRPQLAVHPFEAYTWVMLAAAVAFLRAQGLRIDWQTVAYLLAPMVRSLPRTLLLGLALYAGYSLLSGQGLVPYLRRALTPGWLALWLRLWLACMLVTYTYFWLKVTIPLINPRLWDQALWRLDVALHGGLSPSVFVLELVQGTVLMPLLDQWYGAWITSVFLALSFYAAFPDDLFRRRFLLSCALMWTLGAWIYLGLPALGPVYVRPELWQEAREAMPLAAAGQEALAANYQKILAGRSGQLYQFNPTRGIAALPSLHVAAHFLFALWSRRSARPLYVPWLLATFLTLIGSVLTGWHYAVDGYLGLLLAYVSYRGARWLEPGREGEETEARSG